MILYAITLKNMNKSSQGLIEYVWATKSQIDKVIQFRNDSEKRYRFIKIGNYIFSPMDISHIEEKNTEFYGGPIPKYVKDRYLDDQNKKLDSNTNNKLPYLAF